MAAATLATSTSESGMEQILGQFRGAHDAMVHEWMVRVNANEFMKKVAQGISPLTITQGGTLENFNEQLFHQRMNAGTSYVLAMRLTKRMVKFGREFGFLKLDSKYFQ